MAQPTSFDVSTVLAPVQRRLWMARVAQATLRGLAVGAGIGALCLFADHIHRFSGALPVALGVTVLGAVAGAAWGARRKPDRMQAARVVDLHFALHDRVTTALELRNSDTEFPTLQRSEAESKLRGLSLKESTRGRVRRREFGVPAFALIGLLALSLWAVPVTSGTKIAHAAGDTQRIQQAAKRKVPAISKKLEANLTTAQRNNPALRKLASTLARLRKQLLHTSNRATALRAISRAQQQLHQLSQSLHPINSRAVAQLNSSLNHYMTQQQRAAAQTGNKQALAASAQLLQHLAQQVQHMSASQRAQLARSLARAANQTSDSQLRAALHQAASSLAYNDPQTAASQLQKAANSLQNSQGSQTAQERSQQASTELDSLKNEVSGLSPSSQQGPNSAQQPQGQNGQQPSGQNGRQPGASTAGQGGKAGTGTKGSPGKGLGAISGLGPGKGKGQQGLGKGQGKGRGNGKGQGQGKGQGTGTGQGIGGKNGQPGGVGQASGTAGRGTPGGRGTGGGRGNAGPRAQGKFATVYSPGKQGKGPHSTQTGPTGRPQTGPIVPYTQVVQQYVNQAHAALDRSPLPPSMQQYVQKYFTAISR